MIPVSSPAAADDQDHGQVLAHLAHPPPLTWHGRNKIMNLVMPDLGKILYFVAGTFLGGKLLSKLRG